MVTSQEPGNQPSIRRCNNTCPERLSGNLGTFKCAAEIGPGGYHTGDHRAHLTIRGLGRVTFKWKQRRMNQEPITLDLKPLLKGRRSGRLI